MHSIAGSFRVQEPRRFGVENEGCTNKRKGILGHGGGTCYEFSWSSQVTDIIYLRVEREHGSVSGRLAHR